MPPVQQMIRQAMSWVYLLDNKRNQIRKQPFSSLILKITGCQDPQEGYGGNIL